MGLDKSHLEEDMDTISFRQLPLIAKMAVGVVFYNAWWSLEEFVIDRHGLWKHMPYYRVADPCLWDLVVGLIIVLSLWRLSRRQDGQVT
jgi:hypothetical protein